MACSIAVVIVNYKTAELAAACLRSIAGEIPGFSQLQVVIVDNASGDGSLRQLRELIEASGWRAWARIVPMPCNGGFAYGNNAGIRQVLNTLYRVDYIMLLNPDAVVRPGAIQALAHFLDLHPEVGIAGSSIENIHGTLEASAHNLPSPLGEFEDAIRFGVVSRVLRHYAVTPPMRHVPHECEWVSGASLMIRREVFEQIGLLDEGYFLYFEEVDFCLRARRAKWRVWYVPEACVVHVEGAATGIRSGGDRRPRYWYNSRRRYFVKHLGISGLIFADFLWALGRALFNIRRLLRLGRPGTSRDPGWFAFDLLWGDLCALCSAAGRNAQGQASSQSDGTHVAR